MQIQETKNGGGKGIFRIIEFTNPSGATAYRVTGWTVDGKRIRENFKTHLEATTRKQELEIQAANLETAARPIVTRLTPEQISEAERAYAELNGKPLMGAVRYYLDNYREPLRTITVSEAFKKFIAERKAANLRPASITNLRSKAAELLTTCGDRNLAEVGTETLRELIFKPTRGPKARDNYRRAIHAFFSWAEKQGYVAENPTQKIAPIKADRHDPAIMSPAEAEAILAAANRYKKGALVPYVALALFAGLRPTELTRLTWDRIDLKARTITIGSDMAKMRAKRIVEIGPNLVAWLAPFLPAKPPIVGLNWRRDFDAVKLMAGWGGRSKQAKGMESPELKPWPQDIMRHSAISYHLAQFEHEGKTAAWAGNSPDMIQRHYKGLVKKADARKFWAIKPDFRTKSATPPAKAIYPTSKTHTST